MAAISLLASLLTADARRSGGLLNYGPNVAELHRRTASYVDKILRGAKTADLPIGQ